MNKQFLISAFVIFVATMITGFVVHVVLLGQELCSITQPVSLRSRFAKLFYIHVAGACPDWNRADLGVSHGQ